jgi:drug/metabolite transporter (DMT)-like permease
MPSAWLAYVWIPIVVGAALAQTGRNAAQRSLVAKAGTLGATLARFLFGIPFAVAWVILLHRLPATAGPVPTFDASYAFWLTVGAVGQLAATAFLLTAMKQRNFVVGVAFSKTDALQVALFAALFLGELPGWLTMVAIALATGGVILLSLPPSGPVVTRPGAGGMAAVFGLASGAGFAMSAVGYRGAALALPDASPWLIGAWGVLLAQSLQTLLLGAWLGLRSRESLRAIASAWRVSLLAGGAGALASAGWFTAFALTTAANVRTLGMVEVVFSYGVSHQLLRERLHAAERAGLVLVLVGVMALCLQL